MSNVLQKKRKKNEIAKEIIRVVSGDGSGMRGRVRGPRAAVVRSLQRDEDTANTLMC